MSVLAVPVSVAALLWLGITENIRNADRVRSVISLKI